MKSQKPEKIAPELLAQLKFINHHLGMAQTNLIEWQGARKVLQQYLANAYNLTDGDSLSQEDGAIERKALLP